MSTHAVRVVAIETLLPHTNADSLELAPVSGWQAVVRKGQFKPGDKAIYIEPDYVVPTYRPEFSFLAREGKTRHRLKAIRLRGQLSFGLLIPVPDQLAGADVGEDVMEALEIERYEPPAETRGADGLPRNQWPETYAPTFDLENLNHYPTLFEIGDEVIVTEKIHGANARYLFLNDVFYIGSRTRWLDPTSDHAWKLAVDEDPRIREWCESHPGITLYGEIYGPVQSLRYGSNNKVRFAAFAACNPQGEWVNQMDLLVDKSLPRVPILWVGPYDPDLIREQAELDSVVVGADPGHIREGVVIVPIMERRDLSIGRVALKYISNRYWESAH